MRAHRLSPHIGPEVIRKSDGRHYDLVFAFCFCRHLGCGHTNNDQQQGRKMSQAAQVQAARTPGATRAGEGEYLFELAKVNHILGGPDYSTANGSCVEGERMIVALMRMPAG